MDMCLKNCFLMVAFCVKSLKNGIKYNTLLYSKTNCAILEQVIAITQQKNTLESLVYSSAEGVKRQRPPISQAKGQSYKA